MILTPLKATATALILCLPLGAMAQEWALGGYDPVAYVTDESAVPGRGDIVTSWRGKVYHFASETHRSLFEANPRAYVPGFNGLCVVAISEGRTEPGDPREFVIIGKRVYLAGSAERKQRLLENPREILMKAKGMWLKLRP
ncbi:YHS domain-containing (seleno)protein [Paracoccus aerodenitrificans]|uniref:YHS domain-containing (seleno)protein n=1 Tax=Paracoccus aerodenitrificans TaxID=3017781 RepID=UPI0022F0C58E|nr:YHS domain-containing (seleno)protein [Paracoccus aerodenitrificans]WBU64133.1 YHS domain-containing (seleno)protein [Paracoccus aerodenitrificans]